MPLAATLAEQGFSVIGVDINQGLVDDINAGKNPYDDESGLAGLVKKVVTSGKLKATTCAGDSSLCEVFIIAVPTLVYHQVPEIKAVESVARNLSRCIKKGHCVVLQSTVPPGTTEKVLGKIISNNTHLRPGVDFGLAYSPERTQSPHIIRDLQIYPKIVGASDDRSAFLISELYSTFAPSIIRMSSIIAAEMSKVIENTYRDVNIAFANELALICRLFGIDAREVIAASNSQPYCQILEPGLVGGHCIPMDPYYIINEVKKRGSTPCLIETARGINESIYEKVVNMLDAGLKNITILGLSFKPDIKSFNTSHTLTLLNQLQRRGYEVTIHDPFLDATNYSFKTERNLYQAITGADCIILSTAHSVYKKIDIKQIKRIMTGNLVVDIRSVLKPETVRGAGLRYMGLGYA